MANMKLALSGNIIKRIYSIRGVQVMLDSDLAEMYGVETKVLNKAVKRNIERFPEQFMFKLTELEYNSLRLNFESIENADLRFQNGTSGFEYGGRRYLPYVFTEQGVAMLSGVLRSETAIKVSIQIMNAFVSMRKFISKNAEIFTRLNSVERKQLEFEIKTNANFEKVFNAMQDKLPEKGIFFDGSVFDAHKFVSDLIRSASKSIILIDNYVDDSVLILLSKRKENVSAVIYTKNIPKQLELDLHKHNLQYPPILVKKFVYSHDRFMIIDNKEVYHFGASLKDMGKRWFAFSRFDKDIFKLIGRLK